MELIPDFNSPERVMSFLNIPRTAREIQDFKLKIMQPGDADLIESAKHQASNLSGVIYE